MRRFERGNLFRALKRSRDVVEAFEQRLPLVRVEVEADTQPARMCDLLRLQVDHELVALRDSALQLSELGFAEHDRREAGLDRVGAEDVAERPRDHDAKAV